VKKLSLIGVMLPIGVLLGWCLFLSYSLATGTVVRLRVEGFDPRDLLSGRYIRYSLIQPTYESAQSGCSNGPDQRDYPACACLTPEPNGPFHTISWIGRCEKRPAACELFLHGTCRFQFFAGIEEYFIPEQLAPALQTIPAGSNIVLAVSTGGHSQVKQMLVGETPIEEFARSRLPQ